MRIPDFITRWTVEYTRWIGLVIVIIILALGYVTVLSSKIETVRTEGLLKRTQIEEQLVADTAYRDALAASAAEYQQKISDEERATIEEFIPTSSDLPSVMLAIQDMARRSALELSDILITEAGQVAAAGNEAPASTIGQSETAVAQAATVAGVNLRTQDVNVTVNGVRSYEDIKNFVKVIESSRRLFDVLAISFNLSTNEGATVGTAGEGSPITFSLRTYYLPSAN